MKEPVYSHGTWVVTKGMTEDFVTAFREFVEYILSRPEHPSDPVLLKAPHDDRTYYSFARWPSAEAVEEMSKSDRGSALRARVEGLCDEYTAGRCHLVLKFSND